MTETPAADRIADRPAGNTEFRPFVPPFGEKDFEALSELMAETWLTDFAARPAAVAAQVELCEYVAATTWGCVCERTSDGALLGAILLAEKDREVAGADAWAARGDELLVEASLDATIAEAIRQEMGGVREEESLAAEYLASGEPESGVAVKLLIVSPAARGMGLGKRLMEEARAYLRRRGARGFYLMTDDSCDVSFYDHLGLRQVRRRRSLADWPAKSKPDPGAEFSLYVYAERL